MIQNPPVPLLHNRRLQPPGRTYDAVRAFGRFAFACSMRVKSIGLQHTECEGPAILAVSHVSHLDPVFVSVMVRRRISWMARAEFYDQRLSSGFLDRMGSFPVHRQGHALPAIRETLRRLKRGEMVGIFPEGEITRGSNAVVHGGSIRRGISLLAARSGCPVVPVVVAGTHQLNHVLPWLPAKQGQLWIIAGPALYAPPEGGNRTGREAFATRLEKTFVNLYADLRREFPMPGTVIP